MEFGKSIKHLWLLDDSITFLNHGSFGATPISVIDEADKIHRRLEREPVSFFIDTFFDNVRATAISLGEFVGADSSNLVFVDNATSGVNTVLRSMIGRLKPGDEILINNHTYPAVKSACSYISELTGCVIKEIHLPFPVNDNSQLIDVYEKALNEKTKLLIIDHIIYTTGIINPVKQIAEIAKQNGTLVLVDGAHAPGMIDLNIESLGIDWYTGNCHKWLFAPKGCALLWTSPEHQSWTKPLSISFFHNHSYTMEFDWTGTKNPVPILALNKAIDFHKELGSEKIFTYNHELATGARRHIAHEFGFDLPCSDDLLGSLATLPMPGVTGSGPELTAALRKKFLNDYSIEMPFVEFDDKIWFRFSAQVYNDMQDYEKLADALRKFLSL